MIEIWFVQDYLSGNVLENKHYSEKAEAVEARNRLGYGLVKSHRLQNGGVIPQRDGNDLVAFRATPGERVKVAPKNLLK